MNRAWASVLVFLLAFAFLSIAFAGAARAVPEVTILPDNSIISVNSDLIIKVNPHTSESPIRITWSVYNMGTIGIGSFPMAGGNGLCYFSSTDDNATCGPTPFFQSGETELDVFVAMPGTASSSINTTIPLNISSVSIDMSGVDREDNTVYINIYKPRIGQMTYNIYNDDLGAYQGGRQLDYDAVHGGKYTGNITLNPGVYYFTFMLSNGSTAYGSALKRIEIPSSDFLSVQTDKREYWKGSKIRISGSSSGSVAGEVRFPDGDKALDFTANVSAGNAFYYDFYPESDWPEGTYTIRTSKPLVKTANFTITELFEIRPSSVSGTVNRSGDFDTSLTLKNIRQNATNFSFVVSGGMREQYVTIGKTHLDPQESTTIGISIPGMESSIDGKITLRTTDGLELAIPVKVTVIELGQSCPPPTAAAENELSVDQYSLVWSQDCMADEEIRHEVKIVNNGVSALSDFQYEIDDTGDQSISSLDTMGRLSIPVSGISIGVGESNDVEISITPSSAGKYQGIISFVSGSQKASFFVSLTCFGNITGDISSATENLAALNPGSAVSDDINSDIEQAQTMLALGNYAQANEYAVRAQAKISAIKAGGGGASPTMDFTWIAIIIVIAVVGVVFFLFIKSRKPKGEGAEEGAEELENFG